MNLITKWLPKLQRLGKILVPGLAIVIIQVHTNRLKRRGGHKITNSYSSIYPIYCMCICYVESFKATYIKELRRYKGGKDLEDLFIII